MQIINSKVGVNLICVNIFSSNTSQKTGKPGLLKKYSKFLSKRWENTRIRDITKTIKELQTSVQQLIVDFNNIQFKKNSKDIYLAG